MKQIDMLNKCITLISQNGKLTNYESFEKLMDYMAVKLSLDNEAIYTLPQVVADTLDGGLLDWDLLRSDPWDWLGETYSQLGLCNLALSQFFTPRAVTEAMAQMTLFDCKPRTDKLPITMLDPCVGSGRMILSAHKILGDEAIYFGVDLDLHSYRIALINMALYKIPAFLLRADSLVSNIDLNSENWHQANLWYPGNISKLSKKESV